MVKLFPDKFPLGSHKHQREPGFYMDNFLKNNLEIFADRIVDDMDFVMLISGNGMVRVGKSTLAQQVGTYITETVNEKHKLKNTFTLDNIVFNSTDLIDKANKLPPGSVLILDEGDDLVENYWSHLAKDLRRFFRKCGQLNLFLIVLIPDFFELTTSYALTRTICLIDVRFYEDFKRGKFHFYNYEAKKQLYIRGKKYRDYSAWGSNFDGVFPPLYTIGEKEYRKKKKEDLEKREEEEEKNTGLPKTLEKVVWIKAIRRLQISVAKFIPNATRQTVRKLLMIPETTFDTYMKEIDSVEDDDDKKEKDIKEQKEIE